MEKINNELADLLAAKAQNESIKERLDYLSDKLQKLSIKEQAYLLRTEEELADVKKLEELGVRSLFKKVLGNLQAQIEKEKEEYLLAVLEHKSVEEEVEMLEFEISVLRKTYRKPERIEEELSLAIKKKEFHLKSYDTKFTKELFKRESEIGRYKLMLQKGNKSHELAAKAKQILNDVKDELEDVKDWPPSGKKAQSSYKKKKYIDRARAKAIQAKVRLEEFAEFVGKLFKEIDIKFDKTPFEDFLTVFYNNLITDYVVQDKLDKTLKKIHKTTQDLSEAQEIINKETLAYEELVVSKEQDLKLFILSFDTKKGA